MSALLLQRMNTEQIEEYHSIDYLVQQIKNVLQNNMIKDLENKICMIELKNKTTKQNNLYGGLKIIDEN